MAYRPSDPDLARRMQREIAAAGGSSCARCTRNRILRKYMALDRVSGALKPPAARAKKAR